MAFKHGMTVDFCMAYMLMSITLTLMQGHSGSAKAKNRHWIISTTKQAISIKLAPMVGLFFFLGDLDFENVYMAWPLGFCFAAKGFYQKHLFYLSSICSFFPLGLIFCISVSVSNPAVNDLKIYEICTCVCSLLIYVANVVPSLMCSY